MTIRLANSTRSAMADAIDDIANAGAGAATMQIRTGSQPATPNTAATGTLLATVTLADPAFGAASNGVITLTDPAAVTGVADGTAGWFRILDSNGNAVLDGSVGTSSADLILNTATISTGVSFDILSGGTITVPVG